MKVYHKLLVKCRQCGKVSKQSFSTMAIRCVPPECPKCHFPMREEDAVPRFRRTRKILGLIRKLAIVPLRVPVRVCSLAKKVISIPAAIFGSKEIARLEFKNQCLSDLLDTSQKDREQLKKALVDSENIGKELLNNSVINRPFMAATTNKIDFDCEIQKIREGVTPHVPYLEITYRYQIISKTDLPLSTKEMKLFMATCLLKAVKEFHGDEMRSCESVDKFISRYPDYLEARFYDENHRQCRTEQIPFCSVDLASLST